MKQLLTLVALGASLLVAIPTARAEAPCDDILVDRAGEVSNRSSVLSAASALERQGAVVRVRVIPSIAGYSNLDRYEGHIERDVCESWQGAEGGRRSNLIVLYVSMDRKVGFYAGDLWRRDLESAWPAILEEEVKPRLRDGDVSGALASGISSIERTIARSRAIREAPPVSTQPVIVRQQTEPTDFSGLWNVLGWIVALAALAGIAIFGFRGYSSWRHSVATRESARQKARRERGRCTTAIRTIADALPIAGARINQAEQSFDTETIEGWRATLADITSNHETLAAEFESVRSDPNAAGSAAEFEQMAADDAHLADRLEAVRGNLQKLERKLEEAKLLAEAVSTELQSATTAVNEAKARVEAVREQGFRVEQYATHISTAETALTEAQTAINSKRYRAARTLLEKANVLATEATEDAEALPATRFRLTATIEQAKQHLTEVEASIAKARPVFESLMTSYDRSCYKSVAGNGSEAERLLTKGHEALKNAETALAEQNWNQAEDLAAFIETCVNGIESLMRSIIERASHLQVLATELPKDIAKAEKDLVAAHAYVTENDADTSDRLFTSITNAHKALTEAKNLLAVPQPQYLDIITMVRDAHKTADTVLANARSEVDQAKRQRKLAHTSVRDATAALSRAKEYIQDHRADINGTLASLLGNTPMLLSQAEVLHSQGRLQPAITAAQNAGVRADEAYKSARADVKRAEDARAAAERKRQAAARRRREEEEDSRRRSSNSDDGYSSRSSSSSGFGGSSDFGSSSSSSSGFGGSSDW